MEFQIADVKDNEDDTCSLTIDLDNEALVIFAKIGILKVLIDEANRKIEMENEHNQGDS